MQNGVLLILLSMSLTPFGDALSKQLGATQSPMFIVFLRYFVAGLIALALARVTRTRVELPRIGRLGFILQTAIVVGAMALLIAALSMVPLASAVGGFLIAPIVAMLISVLFYGEKLTLPGAAGAGLSFLGALLILKPGAAFEPGIAVALVGGALLGLFLAANRASGVILSPIGALALQCLLGSAMLFPFAIGSIGTADWALLWPALGLGAVTAATHFLTVAAYQRCESARLAPFFYFNLVAAVIVGLVWFNEIPDAYSVAGLGLILTGGLASLLNVTTVKRLARRRAGQKPPRPRHIYVNS